jgi:Leucine-rich repeat (LRR) protein
MLAVAAPWAMGWASLTIPRIGLELLLLDHNSFEGTIIPQSLKNLKFLALLNLTMNKPSGSIPGNLQQLYLVHNNLSCLIPAVLQNLTLLSKLDLSFNDLQGEVHKGVGKGLT